MPVRSTVVSQRDGGLQESYIKPKLGFSWSPTIPTIIPYRIRRKFRSKLRSRQTPASTSFTSLNRSFSPADTTHALRNHHWSFYDSQYLVLVILAIFSLCIIPSPGPLVKIAFCAFIITALILPISRQFLLPSLFIWMWLISFYACG